MSTLQRWAVVGGFAFAASSLIAGGCHQEDFSCENGFRCLAVSRVCDGHADCSDGSDEVDCGVPGPPRTVPRQDVTSSVTALEQAELAATVQQAHQQEAQSQKKVEQKKTLEESIASEAKKAMRSGAENSSCRNAEQGTECFSHVLYAMSHGIYEHPKWYPGLTLQSDFSAFQALLHLLPENGCPRPCTGSACLHLLVQPLCLLRVDWLQQVELIQHPGWYPELNEDSSKQELAQSLWQRGDPNCYRPCQVGEEDDVHLLNDIRAREVVKHLRSNKPRSDAPALQVANPASSQRCDEHGVTYLPLDMSGVAPRFADSADRCQEFCAQAPGAAYYSFDGPSSVCHCEAAEVGMRHQGSWGFVSGNVGCHGVTLHSDTQLIVQHLDTGCYEAGALFSGPLSGESYEANSLRCQHRLQEMRKSAGSHAAQMQAPDRCERFVFFSFDRRCQLMKHGSQKINGLGVTSGPRHCNVRGD